MTDVRIEKSIARGERKVWRNGADRREREKRIKMSDKKERVNLVSPGPEIRTSKK